MQERVSKCKRFKGEDIERDEGSKVTRLTKLEQSKKMERAENSKVRERARGRRVRSWR